MQKLLKSLLLLLCCISFFYTSAQENNYWNRKFGAKSTLLGSAAVATYFDNGAIFYNPATLCFKDSGNLSLSANLYQGEFLNRKDALGEGLDLNSTNFNFSPQMVSGNKKIGKKTEIEFILFSKTDVLFNQSHSYSALYTDTAFMGMQSRYVGSYTNRKRIVDDWAGISLSFKLTEKLGIGFGSFVSYRFNRYQTAFNASAFSLDTVYHDVAKSDSSLNIIYSDINAILKGGMVYNGDKNNWGFTVTLPSMHIWGRGNVEYAVYLNSQFNGFSWGTYNVYLKRQNLKVKYKMPVTFAAGYTRKMKNSKLHVTAEYFGEIRPYELMSIPVGNQPNEPGDVSVGGNHMRGFKEWKTQTMNLGLGWERTLKGTTELLLGFSTDFNSKGNAFSDVSLYDYNLSQGGFDIFHYSCGVAFQHRKNNIAIGLTYSNGVGTGTALANFKDPTSFSKYFGYAYNQTISQYKSIGLVLGLTL